MKKIDFILSRIAAEHHTTPENVRLNGKSITRGSAKHRPGNPGQMGIDSPERESSDFVGVPGLRREKFDKVLMSFPYFYA